MSLNILQLNIYGLNNKLLSFITFFNVIMLFKIRMRMSSSQKKTFVDKINTYIH